MRDQVGQQVGRDECPVSDSSFPGRAVTGVCMIAGPLVLFVATLVGMDDYKAAGLAYVHTMAAQMTKTAVGFNLVVAGLMFLMLAIVGLAGRVTVGSPSLGRWGGILAVLGLFGPIFFNGVYFAAFQLAGSVHQATAGAMIDRAHIPSNVINIAGPALVLGFIFLAIGARRAGVMGRFSAGSLGATCIIPAGFISGHLVIASVGFLGTTIALVPLGLNYLREPS